MTNTAQDIFIRISFPSSINLQDITVFIIKTTAFCKPKYLKTTKEFAKLPETVLQLNLNRTCWEKKKKKTVVRERRGVLCQIMSSAGIQIYLIMSDDVWRVL